MDWLPRKPTEADLAQAARNRAAAWRVIKPAYLGSIPLAAMAGAFGLVISGEFINSLWWFGLLFVPQYMANRVLGSLVGASPEVIAHSLGVVAVMLFVVWVIHLWVRDIPKSLNRQHSHGNYVHSHKYDERLNHFHDDHTDRVYYR